MLEIEKLPKKKASGPSGLTNEHLIHLNVPMKKYLTLLLSQCINEEQIPLDWKISTLILIPKTKTWGGLLSKTRPIALLETCRRLLSRLLNKRITKYIETIGGLKGQNYGFKKYIKGPEISLMLKLIQDITYTNDQYLEIIQTDIAKAYDSVDLASLTMSLKRICIPQKLIRLIQNTFQNKKTRVLINGSLSTGYSAQIGLEQGDPLSPTFWNIFYDPLLVVLN